MHKSGQESQTTFNFAKLSMAFSLKLTRFRLSGNEVLTVLGSDEVHNVADNLENDTW